MIKTFLKWLTKWQDKASVQVQFLQDSNKDLEKVRLLKITSEVQVQTGHLISAHLQVLQWTIHNRNIKIKSSLMFKE
jgi:hypothetical protein